VLEANSAANAAIVTLIPIECPKTFLLLIVSSDERYRAWAQ